MNDLVNYHIKCNRETKKVVHINQRVIIRLPNTNHNAEEIYELYSSYHK